MVRNQSGKINYYVVAADTAVRDGVYAVANPSAVLGLIVTR